MKFTSHERDRDPTGVGNDVDYMHARYYLHRTGRFLSPDPILGSPDRPQSWNRYAYVMGSPINFIDEYGLEMSCKENQGENDQVSCAEKVSEDSRQEKPEIDPAVLKELLNGSTVPKELRGLRVEEIVALLEEAGLHRTCEDATCEALSSVAEARPGVEKLEEMTVISVSLLGAAQVSVAAKGSGLGLRIFGKGGVLNSNRYLRIGLGRRGGESVFRIGGNLVQKVTGRSHIDLFTRGPL